MKCSGIREYDGAVELLELPDPAISEPGQVLIEVHASGVGNWDNIVRSGDWDVGTRPPMALGVEAAGVVRRVGAAVSRFAIGDEVLTHSVPLLHQGTWAPLFVASEDDIAHKPTAMSSLQAGLFPVPALTAHQVLVAVDMQGSETILVHGAGGITGGLLVAVAAGAGGRVIAVADPKSAERLRSYGVFAVIDYHRPDWQRQVTHLANGRVPVVVNTVRDAAASLLPLLSDNGRLATITGDPPAAERGIQVSNVYVTPDGKSLEHLAADFARRSLTLPVSGVYGLSDASQALSAALGHAGGGVVVDPRR
ncbi:MAG TPA: NADP-dependent oxidoreductase [Casimicrobiaceae bacterium]|jgi:NADPH:quinone reductase-like Zn-dependent oxidoreductase